jgi:D-glycero-D-manno-heptose 1,7-bisphosphate phosphatase
MAIKKKNCVFLDRDGVINIDKGYISTISNFKMYPGIGRAINFINKKKYLVIIVTNQSGIGRGLIKIKQLKAIHDYLRNKIKKFNANIDDIYFCPYHEVFGKGRYKKKSEDRKPGSGMLKKAIKKWNINLSKSFMIGDKKSDKKAAENVNIKFFYKKEKNLNMQIRNIFKIIK